MRETHRELNEGRLRSTRVVVAAHLLRLLFVARLNRPEHRRTIAIVFALATGRAVARLVLRQHLSDRIEVFAVVHADSLLGRERRRSQHRDV